MQEGIGKSRRSYSAPFCIAIPYMFSMGAGFIVGVMSVVLPAFLGL